MISGADYFTRGEGSRNFTFGGRAIEERAPRDEDEDEDDDDDEEDDDDDDDDEEYPSDDDDEEEEEDQVESVDQQE